MCLLKPFKLSFQEIESLHITNNRALPGRMRRLEVGCRNGTAQTMICDHLIHPIEAPKMVFIELARVGRAQGAEDVRGWARPARLQGTPPLMIPLASHLRE